MEEWKQKVDTFRSLIWEGHIFLTDRFSPLTKIVSPLTAKCFPEKDV